MFIATEEIEVPVSHWTRCVRNRAVLLSRFSLRAHLNLRLQSYYEMVRGQPPAVDGGCWYRPVAFPSVQSRLDGLDVQPRTEVHDCTIMMRCMHGRLCDAPGTCITYNKLTFFF